VRHAIDRDDGSVDLAFERGREPVPDPGKPGFEFIVLHGVLPLSLQQASTSDLNRRSGFAVNFGALMTF
jgi:hypothetical protein